MHPVTVDAFSSVPFGGNPAGVAVFEDKLPEEAEMRRIAAKMGYSETAFILSLGGNRFRIRYFTPVEEVPLCGHATVGSFAYMLKTGLVQGRRKLCCPNRRGRYKCGHCGRACLAGYGGA